MKYRRRPTRCLEKQPYTFSKVWMLYVGSRNNEVGASQILSVSFHIPVLSPFCEHGYDNLAQQEASHQGRLSTPRHLLSSMVASASLPPLHQVADIYSLNLLTFIPYPLSVCATFPQCIWLVPLLLWLLCTMEIQAPKSLVKVWTSPSTWRQINASRISRHQRF